MKRESQSRSNDCDEYNKNLTTTVVGSKRSTKLSSSAAAALPLLSTIQLQQVNDIFHQLYGYHFSDDPENISTNYYRSNTNHIENTSDNSTTTNINSTNILHPSSSSSSSSSTSILPPEWLFQVMGNHTKRALQVWNQLSKSQQQQWHLFSPSVAITTRSSTIITSAMTNTNHIPKSTKKRSYPHHDDDDDDDDDDMMSSISLHEQQRNNRKPRYTELLKDQNTGGDSNTSKTSSSLPLISSTNDTTTVTAQPLLTLTPPPATVTKITDTTTHTGSNHHNRDDTNTNAAHKDTMNAHPNTKSNLTSLLQQLDGTKKVTTITKTALDWEQYKDQNHIKETLEQQTTSNTAFLPKQEFLQRVDLRKHEQEKHQRLLDSGKGK